MTRINLKQHFPELDGIRGLAALSVFLYHCLPDLTQSGLGFLAPIRKSLWLGVDLFFVLSGFLITRILMGTYDKPQRLRTFYKRRVLRIFPLYYFALIMVYGVLTFNPIIAADIGQHISSWWYALYSYNFYIIWQGEWGTQSFLNHYWTLAIEEQFYLVWPFLIFSLSPKNWPRLMIGCVLMAMIAKVVLYMLQVPYTTSLTCTLTRMDALSLGGLAAYAHEFGDKSRMVASARRIFWVTLAALSIALIGQRGLIVYGDLTMPFITPLSALFFASLIYLSLNCPNTNALYRKLFRLTWLRNLGHISYGVYVYHWIIFYGVIKLNAFGLQTGNGWVDMGLTGILTIVISMGSYWGVERWIMRLR